MHALLLAFGLVFLSELGDKTQITTMILASQTPNIWPVIGGAALALITTSIMGGFLGAALSNLLPPHILQKCAGLAFLVLGAIFLFKT